MSVSGFEQVGILAKLICQIERLIARLSPPCVRILSNKEITRSSFTSKNSTRKHRQNLLT